MLKWLTIYLITAYSVLAMGQSPPVVISDGTKLVKGYPITLSKKGIEFIAKHETGGRAYYAKYYTGIIWPGHASGPTIGVGHDLGYNTPAQIRKAWAGVASQAEINIMVSIAGKKGRSAKYYADKYRRYVNFTYDEAMIVFKRDSLPRFTRYTANAFKLGKDQLHAHTNSALTSLVFNRGASMSGHSRRHMRYLRDAIARREYHKIPQILRDMKVLWIGKGVDGLLRRRDEEADLAMEGIRLRSNAQ